MENGVSDLVRFFMIIVPIGAVARIAYCLILVNASDGDEVASLKKRARNALVFAVLAQIILSLIMLISNYYQGG